MESDYPFGIFKLFLYTYTLASILKQHTFYYKSMYSNYYIRFIIEHFHQNW